MEDMIHWQGTLLWIVPMTFAVILFAIYMHQDRNWYKNQLKALAQKSQLEQDIELATTDQLMAELAKRPYGFVMVLPDFAEDIPWVRIYINNIPRENACKLLQEVIYIISTQSPTRFVKDSDDI